MAKDKYIFEQIAAREIKGPGITLLSPCNEELVEDLQKHCKSKPPEKKKDSVIFDDKLPVITINEYGIKKRYPNMATVAMAFGYSGSDVIHKLITKGEELRGGLKVRYAEEGEWN
ncbi:hypothetical protein [Periweissella ghanensis]|uniref:Uncharacterized protein n=1 Tax=Periweissella ghanensis TaxID=467997 RepID=A0ABN8BT87_9LACO|nr:hypothetical protein [Periweissella ghanensis]MCM0601314.1 hypothetical protein [Periweissella ghanensis]CAH0419399.1 hypothetical protein WGH24286_01849 [Periweissella ghanensis]